MAIKISYYANETYRIWPKSASLENKDMRQEYKI